jgi:hypothetical protein
MVDKLICHNAQRARIMNWIQTYLASPGTILTLVSVHYDFRNSL